MRILHFAFRILPFCIVVSASSARAQSNWNELLKKSALAQDDLSLLPTGKIIGKRASLDQLSGVMAVQNCFIVPQDPAHVASIFLNWNPMAYSELGIMRHAKVDHPPVPQNFSRLAFDVSQASVRSLLDKSNNPTDGNLNLSRAEAEKLKAAEDGPNTVALAWRDVLTDRINNYQATGIAQALPYEMGDEKVSLSKEIQALIKQIPAITQHFAGLLAVTFNNPGGEKQAESYYWEMILVEREATLLLGAMFQTPNPEINGGLQISDFQYYVSNSFSSSLILYDLIPVVSNGKPATLVWRSDFIFIPSTINGSGMERMATENIILLEVQKAIKRQQKDAS